MQEETYKTPQQVLDTMLERDAFSKWMGLQVDEIAVGYCKLHYRVKDNMLNGFSNIHGGILFSAADSAFAFACNSHGIFTVALDVTISFTRPAKTGDLLTVEAKEIYLGKKTGLYDIKTTNEKGELVALFKGTAYRTSTKV
ncbi:MAG TPA: hydroxyphenylacetyl-CoA thioesterase PaaI [Bacteroidia bacterium]|nr:hydroxyphenylacetyl-CoA thioesterase PaaI [Bacteroidia bacterium]